MEIGSPEVNDDVNQERWVNDSVKSFKKNIRTHSVAELIWDQYGIVDWEDNDNQVPVDFELWVWVHYIIQIRLSKT